MPLNLKTKQNFVFYSYKNLFLIFHVHTVGQLEIRSTFFFVKWYVCVLFKNSVVQRYIIQMWFDVQELI